MGFSISIIVPIYNIQDYVQKCIESIIHQTYRDIEIILVDDGSTDSSGLICDNFALEDNRINVIHKSNGGLISARIAGLQESSSKYIMYVDGDDWISKNCVEKVKEVICVNNVDLVCFGSTYVYPENGIKHTVNSHAGYYTRSDIRKYIFPFLIENAAGQHFDTSIWGKVFKRNFLIELYKNVDTSITMGEDGVITRPYIHRCKSIYIMEDYLYFYNQCNGSSMTKKLKPISWDNTKLIRNILFNEFGYNDAWKYQINRNTVHNLFITCMSQFNSPETYLSKSKSIKKYLKEECYNDAFKNCNYSSFKGRIIQLMLKYKMIFMIYWYYKHYR